MADFPKCKLCGARPVIFSSGRLFHPVTAKDCPIENSKTMEQDQWTALMGADRDAVRYRWLRDNDHLDDWLSAGNSHMDYAANIDADIDSAMGEQQ